MATLSLKNINKIYPNGTQAVFDFNLEIKDKEFICFVGPSGCGKSTTLRMIAGLEDISAGELWIDDRMVNDVSPKDRDIAMVFQSYALYPHMSVYENMAFGLKLRKVQRRRSTRLYMRQLRFLISSIFLTESQRLYQVDRDSELLWDVQLSVSQRYSLWMSLFQILMLS